MTESEMNQAGDIAAAVSELSRVLAKYDLTLQRVEVTRKALLPLKVNTASGEVVVEGPRPAPSFDWGQQLVGYGNKR